MVLYNSATQVSGFSQGYTVPDGQRGRGEEAAAALQEQITRRFRAARGGCRRGTGGRLPGGRRRLHGWAAAARCGWLPAALAAAGDGDAPIARSVSRCVLAVPDRAGQFAKLARCSASLPEGWTSRLNSGRKNSEVVRLPLSLLQSAGSQYQRPLDWRRVERLAQHLRPESLGTLLINQRPDGTYWIVDGQHRIEAMRQVYGEAFAWWAFLIHVAGPAEEAAIFVEVNAEHARPTPGVLFQGRLIRGEPAALAIERAVIERGLSLHLTAGREGPNEVSTAVLDEIYSKWGGERVRDAAGRLGSRSVRFHH